MNLVRRVWIYKDIKPVVKITGSHKHLCLFRAAGLNGKRLFREYNRFNGKLSDADTFQISKMLPVFG